MKKCLNCETELDGYYQNKFCSHSCSAQYNNKKRGIVKKCLFCGNEIKGKKRKFCNNSCQQKFYYDYRKDLILNDKINELLNTIYPIRIVKRVFIEKYGNKCMKCGWNEINPYTKKVPIELEHRDGNSDNWKL